MTNEEVGKALSRGILNQALDFARNCPHGFTAKGVKRKIKCGLSTASIICITLAQLGCIHKISEEGRKPYRYFYDMPLPESYKPKSRLRVYHRKHRVVRPIKGIDSEALLRAIVEFNKALLKIARGAR